MSTKKELVCVAHGVPAASRNYTITDAHDAEEMETFTQTFAADVHLRAEVVRLRSIVQCLAMAMFVLVLLCVACGAGAIAALAKAYSTAASVERLQGGLETFQRMQPHFAPNAKSSVPSNPLVLTRNSPPAANDNKLLQKVIDLDALGTYKMQTACNATVRKHHSNQKRYASVMTQRWTVTLFACAQCQ